MKVREQLLPPIDCVLIGPHKSVCTSSIGCFAHYATPFGKLSWCRFPKMQHSQVLAGSLIGGNPLTLCFCSNNLKPEKCKCPNRKCHNQYSLEHATVKELPDHCNS